MTAGRPGELAGRTILILLTFSAPFGGLQDHARAQALAIRRAGGEPVVFLTAGPFSDRLEAEGFRVIRDTGEAPGIEASRLLDLSGVHPALIHAHPFRADRIARIVQRITGAPLILTVHSLYDVDLSGGVRDAAAVTTVSAAARDRIVAAGSYPPERVQVIHNGCDLDVFRPSPGARDAAAARFRAAPELFGPERRIVTLASRFDPDKSYIVDLALDLWRLQSESRRIAVTWIVAGAGSELERMKEAAAALAARDDSLRFVFTGWLDQADLRLACAAADAALAPGRCAIEALACGTPVIALGSKGYVGPAPGDGALLGLHTNFGGDGVRRSSPEKALAQLEYFLESGEDVSDWCVDFVRLHFDQSSVNARLLSLYRDVVSRSGAANQLPPAVTTGLPFSHAWMKGYWRLMGEAGTLLAEPVEDGAVRLSACHGDGEKTYIHSPIRGMQSAPTWRQYQVLRPGSPTRVEVSSDISAFRGDAQLFTLYFNRAGRRVGGERFDLARKAQEIELAPPATAHHFSLAYRIAGQGALTLDPPRVLEPGRPRGRPGPFDERLVFILGAPRSGTTWLLNMLRRHPGVEAATEDNLGVREKERATLETNVFNPKLALSIPEIKERFRRLSEERPGKVIVEKTPIHLIHHERILEAFPGAHLILLSRDPRAAVASLLKVGRTPGVWWSSAPAEAGAAAALVARHEAAAWRLRRSGATLFELSYEDMHRDTESRITAILTDLGLDPSEAGRLVFETMNGAGLPIAGVFQSGDPEGWRSYLTDEEVKKTDAVFGGPFYECLGPLLAAR